MGGGHLPYTQLVTQDQGVLGQCAALAHLNLSYNSIDIWGEVAERLRASWRGQASALLLEKEEEEDDEEADGLDEDEDEDEVQP